MLIVEGDDIVPTGVSTAAAMTVNRLPGQARLGPRGEQHDASVARAVRLPTIANAGPAWAICRRVAVNPDRRTAFGKALDQPAPRPMPLVTDGTVLAGLCWQDVPQVGRDETRRIGCTRHHYS